MGILEHLMDLPVANLLILAGLGFLAVAGIGKITGKIEPDIPGRVICGLVGLGLVLYGVYAHSAKDKAAPPGVGRKSVIDTTAQKRPGRAEVPEPAFQVRVHSKGEFTLRQTWAADLDEGVEATGSKSDLWFEAVTATERYLVPQHGAALALVGLPTPTPERCRALPLSTARIPVDEIPVGAYVCFRTQTGHFGRFRLTAPVGPSPGQLKIAYVTWE